MRTLVATLLAASLAAAAVTACTGDDDNALPGGDAGSDVRASDAQAADGGRDANAEGGPSTEGGDGGCDFATFVTGLIQTQTTMSASPSTDLGQSCTDKQDPSQFQPLFP